MTELPRFLKPHRSILFAVLLLPVIFLPMSNDLSIFMRGGETVLSGGKLYRDFIDLKPPLIYYIAAIPQILFGSSVMSPRLFDFLWQLATALSLYFVASRVLKSESAGAISSAVYCILYATLNSTQTFTCEGFSAIAIVWIMWFQLRKPGIFKNHFLIGFLAGWCIALKFTLGIVLFAVLFDDIINENFKKNQSGFFKKYGAIAAGAFISVVLGLSPLFDYETFTAYRNVLDYLVYYTAITPVTVQFFREALGSIAVFFGDTFSFVLFFTVIVTFTKIFKKNPEYVRRTLWFCFVLTVFLLISVIIERRFTAYYFSRMYIPLSVLSGFGFIQLYSSLRGGWQAYHSILKVLLLLIILLMLPFSPLPRFISMARMSGLYVSNPAAYQEIFEREGDNFQNYSQQKEIAQSIASRRKPGENVFVMSIGASPIYNFLKEQNASKFAHSQFYFGNGVPQNWLDAASQEVFKTTWLVVQLNDGHPILNGHTRDSFSSLKKDTVLWPFVSANFSRVDSTSAFYIFKRHTPVGER